MFMIAAAILFGVALILDVADQAGDLVSTLTLAGFLCMAIYFLWPTGPSWPARR